MASASSLPINPWRTIWWQPQATIREVLSRGSNSHVLLLAAAGGASLAVMMAGSASVHWFAALAFALLIGPLLGIVHLYINGAVTTWAGRLLGGRASQRAVRTAVAWSWAPQIIALALVAGSIAAFGPGILREGDAPVSNAAAIVGLLLLVLNVWGFFITVRTVGAVQDFGLIRSFANVVIAMLALVAATLLIRFFLFQPFSIPAGSMRPSLLIGDYFFANKLSYGYSRYSCPFCPAFAGRVFAAQPDRGDIVVFKLPRDNTTDHVKRVIGLPGDEISVRDGVLFINGAEVPRRRVENFPLQLDGEPERPVPAYEETLPNGVKYTVIDAEQNGPFDNVGPYKVPEGHYFVMGDNRDYSTDSRASWGVGYVPFDNLLGRASLIYLSVNPLDGNEGPSNALDNVRWDRLFRVPR